MPRKKPAGANGASHTGATADPEAIARRAYEIYLTRGGTHGADLDDWLEAERQLNGAVTAVSAAPARPRRKKPAGATGL